MKFRVNTKQRYLSVFFAVLFVVNGLFIGANIFVSADETIMYDGDTLRGWQVDCVWENGTKDLDIVSDLREDLTLKLSVTYYAPLSCMTQDYPPGTVKFSIPDFGVLKRSGTSFQAKTVADQADTDWNCQYDVQSQMYVFTNAKTFEAEKPLSGGFEILWVAASRQSMTDFSMTESPLFTIENECTRMTPMSLTCETKRDFYIIDLERELISYQQFEDPSINKSGYVSYNYKTYFYLNEKARAGYLNSYFIKVNFNNDTVTDQQMSDIIAQYWDGNKKTETRLTQITDPVTNETVWGFYRFVDKETESLGYYNSYNFILSYPRSLISKTATVDTELLVLYYDEDEYVNHINSTNSDEKLFDSDNVEINEYRFWYGDGNFSMIKYSPYEKDSYTNGGTTPEKYSDRLLAKKIFRNEKVTFTLGGGYRMSTTTSAGTKTTSSSSQTDSNANGYIGSDAADLKTGFDFILGDDRLSVDLNDGSFRMLKGDEYTFTRVIGPVDSQKCDYELYVSNVAYNTSSIDPETGAEIPKVAAENEYRLFGEGNTEEMSVFDLTNIASHAGFEDYTDGVKAIYIKIKNFVGEYNPTYRADIAFHFDLQSDLALEESKRINTNGKITDYGFMRAFYTGTHNDAFSISDVNFLREAGDSADMQNFAQLLMALDDGGYGRYLYHSMSNVFLRDVVTIVSSETTVTSKARSKAEGGGYKINIDSKGTIKVKDESPGELERFSLYVKIPPLLTIDNRLSDIKLSGCYGVNQFGETVRNADFENNVTYSLITLSDGDRAIVADFDFSENPLEISQTTFINLKIPAQVLYTDLKTTVHRSFEVRTFTMVQDEGIGKVEGFEYYWNRQFAALDTYDLNRNGKTDEVLGGSYHGVSYENIVEQWVDTATKLVKSYRDEVWKLLYDSTVDDWYSETEVNAYSSELGENENKRATYSYRLSIDLGSGASDILFSDVLENEKIDDNEVTWRGTLNSIDFTYAIGLGLVPSVYYSTQEIEYQERRQNNGVWVNNLDQFSSDTAEEWNDGIWTAPVSGIRSLAIRFSTAALTDGIISKKHIYFVENLTAPELTPASVDPERPPLGLYARNKHTVYYKSKNLNTRIRLDSKNASVKLLPPVVLVKMIKKDGETGKVLTGAEFSFFKDAEGTEPVIDWEGNIIGQNVRLNNFGELDIDTLEPGIYWYRETVPPAGYHLDPTLKRIDLQHYDVSYLDNSSYVIPNDRLTGTIVFTKKDADDEYVEGIPNAVYALFDANGISVFTDENNAYQETGGTKTEFTTDENGQIVITNLPWGNYYLLEQSAPEGYDMNDTKVWANVSRNVNVEEQTEANAIVVYCHQDDTEQTAAIRLTKYDRDGVTPLANAWFSLERKNDLGEWQTVPGFEYIKTGRNGIVTAEELKFGTYRFKEIIAPTGYELDTENQYSDEVTLTAQTVGTTLKVTKTNERILGSATLRKYSDDGIPLNGAKFDLYMVNGEIDTEPLQAGDTEDIAIRLGMETKTINGQTGMLETVTGLDWGKYYFKEFSSPSGYSKDDGIYSFEVTAENAAITFDSFKPENERKKGEVVLNKTAGEPVPVVGHNYSVGEGIPNAEFELFTSAGAQVYVKSGSKEVTDPITGVASIVDCYTVCESTDADAIRKMKTNADGQLRVDGIFWGSYYFEETKAPDGFSLSEKVRFTVNAASCLAVQELECEDYAMKCLIRIDKEIDDKLEVFGTPTFTFKVINTDTNADYTRMITLSGDAMSGTTTVQVPVGNYRIYEVSVNRYKLIGTEYVEAGTTVPAENRSIVDNEFFVTLSSESGVPQTAEVKFTNSLDNYFGISHTDAINNIIPTKRKVTGFSLELNDEYIACARTEHNNFVITKDMLSGVINYDDGTSVPMDETQLNSVLPQNWTIDNGYLNAGQAFMLNAQFTEGGKTYKTNFVATVGPYKVIESQKVIFRADVDNKSVFEIDGKLMGVNTVYYNSDDNDNKIVISGEYITPTVVTGDGSVTEWEILNGPDAGQKIKAKNDAVAQYLKDNYDGGLRELELRAVINGLVVDFDYTGEVQEFIAPYDGIYYIEGWGAQGGGSKESVNNTYPINTNTALKDVEGGRGGYSYGYVYLTAGQTVYIAVGGKGSMLGHATGVSQILERVPGGYNGGGFASDDSNYFRTTVYQGSGGGATHFALNNNLGELKNYNNSQSDILLVAGGGGGSGLVQLYDSPPYRYWYRGYGGAGGGLTGSNSINYGGAEGVHTAYGGTQTAGGYGTGSYYQYLHRGSFGQGADYGGGGGWYGGGAATQYGSAGGSGHVGDNMIMGETIGGNNTFAAPDGTDETGHVGDGHARITYVKDAVDIPYSGKVGSFTAPVTGLYQLEAWGAAGGGSMRIDGNYPATWSGIGVTQAQYDSRFHVEGGRGGYSSGYIYLTKGTTIYCTVGEGGKEFYQKRGENFATDSQGNKVGSRQGDVLHKAFNGGGAAVLNDNNGHAHISSGGGATHFALSLNNNGELKNYSSDRDNILLVAGGGGGSGTYLNLNSQFCYFGRGGSGGGIESQGNYDYYTSRYSYQYVSKGSTQSSAGQNIYSVGSFGEGGGNATSGGGGGFFGGSSASGSGSAGGSGFINTVYLSNARNVNGAYYDPCYEGKTYYVDTGSYITSTNEIVEEELIPTHAGAIVDNGIVGVNSNDTEMIGNRGDGYARVTLLAMPKESINFDYTGEVQTFTAPNTGAYILEAWGAQGGSPNNTTSIGGNGGYTSGVINLNKDETIYVYVGGEGDIAHTSSVPGGWNGGGAAEEMHPQKRCVGAGGGATDFRLVQGSDSTDWQSFDSLKSRIMVAAGGGGGVAMQYGRYNGQDAKGGAGGGLTGIPGQCNDRPYGGLTTYQGGTQSSGGYTTDAYMCNPSEGGYGFFGYAADTTERVNATKCSPTGGGGYYGGGTAVHTSGAGGGSSFISGYAGCDAITADSTEDNIVHTGQPNHYSGKVFANGVMIDGASSMTQPDGTVTTGHSGNGYARITCLG